MPLFFEKLRFVSGDDSDYSGSDVIDGGLDEFDGPSPWLSQQGGTSKRNSAAPTSVSFGDDLNRCHLCEVKFNSFKHAKDHYNGQKHRKQKMKTNLNSNSSNDSQSQQFQRPEIVKSCGKIPELEDASLEKFYETMRVVKTTPRYYQHDLYRRMMADDSAYFCFLPTGEKDFHCWSLN